MPSRSDATGCAWMLGLPSLALIAFCIAYANGWIE